MQRIIGLDEAGLGPNLGPFVAAAIAWDVPGSAEKFDFYAALSGAVSRERSPGDRLQIADSKQVYSPARGLAELEASALALLALAGVAARNLSELLEHVTGTREFAADPHHAGPPLDLPAAAARDDIERLTRRLAADAESAGIACAGLAVDVVFPRRFNLELESLGNKSTVCSRLSLGVLRRVWRPAEEAAFVIADRFGGRARYEELLLSEFAGLLPMQVRQSPEASRYRLGRGEISFETGSERHFPAAAASIVAKYLRELCMLEFNRFWRQHLPQVPRTAGYPEDAKRFAADVARVREELEIPLESFWRAR